MWCSLDLFIVNVARCYLEFVNTCIINHRTFVNVRFRTKLDLPIRLKNKKMPPYNSFHRVYQFFTFSRKLLKVFQF